MFWDNPQMKMIQRHYVIAADEPLNLSDFKAPHFSWKYSKHHLSLFFDDNDDFEHFI